MGCRACLEATATHEYRECIGAVAGWRLHAAVKLEADRCETNASANVVVVPVLVHVRSTING